MVAICTMRFCAHFYCPLITHTSLVDALKRVGMAMGYGLDPPRRSLSRHRSDAQPKGTYLMASAQPWRRVSLRRGLSKKLHILDHHTFHFGRERLCSSVRSGTHFEARRHTHPQPHQWQPSRDSRLAATIRIDLMMKPTTQSLRGLEFFSRFRVRVEA